MTIKELMMHAVPPTPASARRTFRWRRTVAGIGIAVLLLVSAGGACTEWLAHSIVYAPNQGKPAAVLKDASPDQLSEAGIDRELSVEVGPPPASMALWVMEPSGAVASDDHHARGTVLVLHGINSGKYVMTGVGRLLSDNGYRAVLVDLRGHGGSTGQHLTFGVVEKRDLSQVLDALDAEGLLQQPVGVYGTSYGAAVGIQLAAEDARVAAVVAVAPFTSMREVVPRYVRRYIPGIALLGESIIQHAIDRAGEQAGFNPDEASPRDALSRARAHVLLIHGREDQHIPFEHSERLHEASPRTTDLLIVDGEDHDSIMADRSSVVAKESMAFLRQWMVPSSH